MTDGIDVVLRRDTVGGQEVDNLSGAEASVGHASKDLVHRIGGQRDQAIRRDHRLVRAASKELEARTTAAVAHTDGARKLDAAEVML